MAVPKLLVVGGNGFLGSAICKAAVSKGWQVSSISSSGTPYQTPAGHTPSWSTKVTWHQASAFHPPSYASYVSESTAVVHTLGILLEDPGYKGNIKAGNVFGLAKAVLSGGSGRLKGKAQMEKGYEGMNRDSALRVLETMLSTPSTSSSPRSFVYISAADAFRPIIPARYIETKREAEMGIAARVAEHQPAGSVLPLIIRPGLMYHPHIRPISTLPAFLLSLSATLHDKIPLPNPFPSESFLGGAADAFRTHPLHVDHVAEAVIRGVEERREGVVDIEMIRQWAGFKGVFGGEKVASEGA